MKALHYVLNQKQSGRTSKNVLEQKRINFVLGDTQKELSDWQKKLIDHGLKDIEMGKTTSNLADQDKAKVLCSR